MRAKVLFVGKRNLGRREDEWSLAVLHLSLLGFIVNQFYSVPMTTSPHICPVDCVVHRNISFRIFVRLFRLAFGDKLAALRMRILVVLGIEMVACVTILARVTRRPPARGARLHTGREAPKSSKREMRAGPPPRTSRAPKQEQ